MKPAFSTSFNNLALSLIITFTIAGVAHSETKCSITLTELQNESVHTLREMFPKQKFDAETSPEIIKMGTVEIGLQNLRRKLCQTPNLSDESRSTTLREYFQQVIPNLLVGNRLSSLSWNEAKKRITIQLMHADYLRLNDGKKVLTSRPFVDEVYIGAVIEDDAGYVYVREEDRVRWKVGEEKLFEIALKNLDLNHATAGLKGNAPPDPFIASETKDGFDAARLLLPWVRKEAAKRLGNPFFAAVPNRDFLIMWGMSNSSEFQKMAKLNVETDFKTQAYRLSPKLIKVWENGKFEVIK